MLKRIVLDINSSVPLISGTDYTGIGRTTLELANALMPYAHDLPFEIMLYSQNMKGVGVHQLHTPFKKRHLYVPYRESFNNLLLKFPIKECLTKYDMMHIPHNYEIVRNPEKCIITLHDAMMKKSPEFHDPKAEAIFMPFIQSVNHIITCSESSKKDIIETMHVEPEKISVIYWGIKHHIFKKSSRDKSNIKTEIKAKWELDQDYFLTVSCNTQRKRTDKLIQAYIRLARSKKLKNHLVLIWQSPPKELLEQVKQSGFQDQIHFLSDISDKDLALFYNGATAMFFPSSYEGFGLPVIESMACGCPVITCNNSSLGEIGGDAAIYLTEPVEYSLPEMLDLIDQEKIDLRPYIQKGLIKVKNFKWNKTAEQTLDIYKKALNI